MKKSAILVLAFVLACMGSFGQLQGLGKKLLDKATTVSFSSLLKTPDAITTSFKDVNHTNSLGPDGIKTNFPSQPNMNQLQRTPNGGYILKEGFYYYQAQSYCLKAGTQGPSKGFGYMYAPTKGLAEEQVLSIVRNSVNRPEIPQKDIQLLLWAIIAHAKFEDLQPKVKATAAQLLTPAQLAQLNRTALDFVPEQTLAKAKASVPKEVKMILDAENQLRQMLTSATSSYADMERVAVLAADNVLGNEETKPGTWTWHPTGYYIRFFPVVYYQTRVEVYVPNGSAAVGKEFDPAMHIAAPALTGRQRLLMSARGYSDGSTQTPVPPATLAEAITTSLPNAKWGDPAKDNFVPREAVRSMLTLQRTPNGGFVLEHGYYEFAAQSFPIKAGRQVASPGGAGYLYAPPKGPREDAVMTVLRNSVNRPEIPQAQIQELIDALVRGLTPAEFTPTARAVAAKLLTARQQDALNTPLPVLTDTTTAFRITTPVPEGRWSTHPDGYFVRYKPVDARTLLVQIWVPQGAPGAGKEFDPATHVAVPAHVSRDRIMFAGRQRQ
ncbi:MAG TPA: hypothetical protein VD993_00030 [Chitinophagaceae bacterium]|nr:hypothetical protein [Chitinophagaceae bacterium]